MQAYGMQSQFMNGPNPAATQRTGSEQFFGFLFLILAGACAVLSFFAPLKPDALYISVVLGSVSLTLSLLLVAKSMQPKPINWITADVLFATSFSLVHFAYFFYWVLGATGKSRELWYMGHYPFSHTVCVGLAMYAAAVNCFLAGYYLVQTRRWIAVINEQPPSKTVRARWGQLGRLLVRLGCAGFCAFIAIVGPAKFFGAYSGTNNISFVANIFFQIGQVMVMAGMAVSMAAKQRLVATKKRKSRFSLGISFLDAILVGGLLFAIGIHGDRSTLLYLVGAFAVAYSEYVKPPKAKTLVLAALVLVFFLGFILAFRSAKTDTYDFDPLNNINAALQNIGTSSVCGFVAIANTEAEGHTYGWMQIKQLAGIVPFGRRLFGIGDSIDNSSAMKLTHLIQGKVGSGVAGTGSSVFADYYFDFGLYGTMILFIAAGFLAKRVQNRARTSTSILWQVVLVTLVAFLAVCSRYTLTSGLIRTVLYSSIYTWFIFFAFGAPTRYRRRSRVQNRQFGMLPSPGHRSP